MDITVASLGKTVNPPTYYVVGFWITLFLVSWHIRESEQTPMFRSDTRFNVQPRFRWGGQKVEKTAHPIDLVQEESHYRLRIPLLGNDVRNKVPTDTVEVIVG